MKSYSGFDFIMSIQLVAVSIDIPFNKVSTFCRTSGCTNCKAMRPTIAWPSGPQPKDCKQIGIQQEGVEQSLVS
jgi:hypothetical protein